VPKEGFEPPAPSLRTSFSSPVVRPTAHLMSLLALGLVTDGGPLRCKPRPPPVARTDDRECPREVRVRVLFMREIVGVVLGASLKIELEFSYEI
jgi:hypothetical protein